MNLLLILLIVLVILIPLWLLWGSSETSEKDTEDNNFDRKPGSLSERSHDTATTSSPIPEEPEGPRRRKSDIDPTAGETVDIGNDFQVPFQSDQIVDEQSPLAIYRNTLQNAEHYARRGDFATARELMEGVRNRMGNPELREKIDRNLEYLNNYQQIASKRQEQRMQDYMRRGVSPEKEIRVSLSALERIPERIQIQVAPQPAPEIDIESIVEKISERILPKHLDENAPPAEVQNVEPLPLVDEKPSPNQSDMVSEELGQLREEINRLQTQNATMAMEYQRQLAGDMARMMKMQQEQTSKLSSDGEERVLALQDEIERLKRQHDAGRENEINNLRDQIGSLLQNEYQQRVQEREQENSLLKEQIASMQQIVEELRNQGNRTRNIGEQLEDLARQTPEIPAETAQRTDDDERIKHLQSEIESMRLAMSAMQQLSPQVIRTRAPRSRKPAIQMIEEESDATLISEITDESEVIAPEEFTSPANENNTGSETEIPAEYESKQESVSENNFETDNIKSRNDLGEQQQIPAPQPAAIAEPARSSQSPKPEEPFNEFGLLKEKLEGAKDEGPSEEEIMEKILSSGKKSEQKPRKKPDQDEEEDDRDYEILGTPKKEKEIDFEKLMRSEMSDDNSFEEEFYNKFLRKENRPKKELPILKVRYNFSRLPENDSLSREKNVLEYSFYKYKPMLDKAQDLLKKHRVRDALNYYRVVYDQNIPPEFKEMIGKNIEDINEYLNRYLT